MSPITGLGKVAGALTAVMGVKTVTMMTDIDASSFANKMAQREGRPQNQIIESLNDGVITDDELEQVESLAKSLSLSEEEVATLI